MRSGVMACVFLVGLAGHAAAQGGYVRALWDMNPSAENVEHYYVQLDSG